MSECIKTQDPTKRCLQETHFKYKDTYRLKIRGQSRRTLSLSPLMRTPKSQQSAEQPPSTTKDIKMETQQDL